MVFEAQITRLPHPSLLLELRLMPPYSLPHPNDPIIPQLLPLACHVQHHIQPVYNSFIDRKRQCIERKRFQEECSTRPDWIERQRNVL